MAGCPCRASPAEGPGAASIERKVTRRRASSQASINPVGPVHERNANPRGRWGAGAGLRTVAKLRWRMARGSSGQVSSQRMISPRTAIVLGGSGSVGTALLRALFHDDGFGAVISLSRRSLPEAVAMANSAGRRLVEKIVPEMKAAPLAAAALAAAKECDGELEGFSVLGIGAGTAKLTLEEHRAVDVALNEAFARGLRDSGKVRHLVFMSAAGADPAAKTSGSGAPGMSRYNRVKGESEEAVRASGPPIVSVFRPAMIIGSRHTPWLLEKALPLFSFATPAKYKSVRVEQIAQAMVAAAKHRPKASATYHYPEMLALIANGQGQSSA
jgi:uncharacterized protein YbjT (DUF2867 family)